MDTTIITGICDMTLNEATIRIKNLRLRTYIGFNDDEIKINKMS